MMDGLIERVLLQGLMEDESFRSSSLMSIAVQRDYNTYGQKIDNDHYHGNNIIKDNSKLAESVCPDV